MTMQDYALQELKKLEKQIASENRQLETFRSIIANDNRKLEAWKTIIKEYASEEYPRTEKMNLLILECINKHSGQATLQQMAECIEEHQIMMPRNRLSLLLTKHQKIKYDREIKMWKLKEM